MLSTTSSEGFIWPQNMSRKDPKQMAPNKVPDSVYENIDAVNPT